MIFDRQINKWGGSLAVVIPLDLAKFLNLEEGTEICIQEDEGKHGKFISIWRKDQK